MKVGKVSLWIWLSVPFCDQLKKLHRRPLESLERLWKLFLVPVLLSHLWKLIHLVLLNLGIITNCRTLVHSNLLILQNQSKNYSKKSLLTCICFINSHISTTFVCELAEYPVVRRPISIAPVFGSVALYYIACLIKRTASSTSFLVTSGANRIFAIASEILIIDSSYLGVAVIVFFAFPRFLI